VNTAVRQIFRELADTPQRERERVLAERSLPSHVRSEVVSLLRHDLTSGTALARPVLRVVEEAVRLGPTLVPRTCGPYRLVRLLGTGGMGAVYLAERHDGEIEHKVAMKLLRADADSPSRRERFLRERQLLAYLNHPSIARLLDAGHTADGRPWLAMEYVDGTAIDSYAASLSLPAKLSLLLSVCDSVSYAHRRCVIHRDLKPSNILVDSSGQPKLLDFGIAKLLDSTSDQTQTVERMLTPNYASPEQVRGDVQTTATDVYSLGAVLHKLLTGRSPRGTGCDTPESTAEDGSATDVSPDAGLQIPQDLLHIVRKAMREDPDERYASVDLFADDIRAYLDARPVKARSGAAWYRASKFLRRYRYVVAIVAAAGLVLWLGFHIAAQQQRIAKARSAQVWQLTRQFLALDEVVGGLHNSSESMHSMVAMSKEYLQTFARDGSRDPKLKLDLVEAYSSLARAEGICIASNSRQRRQAAGSLGKAKALLKPILAAGPKNRRALLLAAKISHDAMVLAASDRQRDATAREARDSVAYLERLMEPPGLSSTESATVSELFYEIALAQKNLNLAGEAIRNAERSIEAARTSPTPDLRLSFGLSLLADLFRITGDLEAAVATIGESRKHLENVHFPNEIERRSAWAAVLSREVRIVGGAGGIGLNRPEEATRALRNLFDVLDDWARNDGGDAWSRLLFAAAGSQIGGALSVNDTRTALDMYDHALSRVREVKDNDEARRGEAELLAGSAYALRRLNRIDEAKDRIDTAFRLLAQTRDYPATIVVADETAEVVLRSLGDHFADTGNIRSAVETYENLLRKMTSSGGDVNNNLSHAVAVSRVYSALARVHRRSGEWDRAMQVNRMHAGLWQRWNRMLPNNAFVRRRLESTGSHPRSADVRSRFRFKYREG
jgi:tRNA A-37 threonylcarbamoyl transferase component Bud32/tetratricopeptide (TPR) repeat protein